MFGDYHCYYTGDGLAVALDSLAHSDGPGDLALDPDLREKVYDASGGDDSPRAWRAACRAVSDQLLDAYGTDVDTSTAIDESVLDLIRPD